MGMYSYVTNRTLKNKAGEDKGKLKAFVKTGETLAQGDYVCPECSHEGKINQEFKRPFSLKCEGCGITLKVPKLKGKKKKKKS